MKPRRYPVGGRTQFLNLLDGVDYVEYKLFDGDNFGYFCATCVNFVKGQKKTDGFCAILSVAPVKTYGCCNAWELTVESQLRTADGATI